MNNVVGGLQRQAAKDFEMGGYRIPKVRAQGAGVGDRGCLVEMCCFLGSRGPARGPAAAQPSSQARPLRPLPTAPPGPQGTLLLLPLTHMALTDERFASDDPAAFRPERMMTAEGMKPGAQMPFGHGPRCGAQAGRAPVCAPARGLIWLPRELLPPMPPPSACPPPPPQVLRGLQRRDG